MELAPVPHRRWSRLTWVLLAVVALAPVTVLALLPTAFGLERYVIAEDTAGDAVSRGSVVLAQSVPSGDIAPDDLITVRVDPADPALSPLLGDRQRGAPGTTTRVTRRVVDVGRGDLLVLVADREAGTTVPVHLADAPTMSRVVLEVPAVGYPFLGGLAQPVWACLCLALGLLLGLLCVRPRPGLTPAGTHRHGGSHGAGGAHVASTTHGARGVRGAHGVRALGGLNSRARRKTHVAA